MSTNVSRAEIRALVESSPVTPPVRPSVIRTIRRYHHETEIARKVALFSSLYDMAPTRLFEWGVFDCSLVIADWLVMLGYEDPVSDLRGSYSTEAECAALLRSRGGLLSVFTTAGERAGLRVIAEPEFGAVGVIGSRTRQFGAVWNGWRWMMLMQTDSGMCSLVPFVTRPYKMWGV